ncbi:restriction endonuclease subunit S [Mycoplasma sp. MV126]|uniref:restriction endonuclease subunit S n=1 Tax=Mycoplasma sp. MV126 TaxID=3401676 RepID=UPI003AAE6B95
MQKEKIVPDIRFKGFDENFRIIKLNEIAEYRNGKGHENFVLEKGKYILVNSKFISSNGSQCKYTNINISPLLKNDIVMVLSDIPGGKALAKTFLIENDDKYALNQRICALTSKSTSPIYLNIILNRNSQLLALDDHVNQTNINRQQVMNLQLLIPSYVEQEKIGKLFSSLDLIIESQKSKLEKLQRIKQSLLNKMFVSDDQKIPEIRFKGFHQEWKRAMLSDCLDYERPDKYIEKLPLLEFGQIPVLTANKSFKLGYTESQNYYAKGDCILFDDFTLDSKYVDFPFMVVSSALKILSLKNSQDSLPYYFAILKNNTFESQGHARHYISIVAKTPIKISNSIEERNQIGLLFTVLDSIIHSQEQKLEKLNNIKKALLEKMFC